MGGSYALKPRAVCSERSEYTVTAGNYEVTDCELSDEYTYISYGTIKIKGQDGKLKDKNIVVSYQLVDGEPTIASVSLQ